MVLRKHESEYSQSPVQFPQLSCILRRKLCRLVVSSRSGGAAVSEECSLPRIDIFPSVDDLLLIPAVPLIPLPSPLTPSEPSRAATHLIAWMKDEEREARNCVSTVIFVGVTANRHHILFSPRLPLPLLCTLVDVSDEPELNFRPSWQFLIFSLCLRVEIILRTTRV